MSVNINSDQLTHWYGDAPDGSAPTPQQWQAVLSRPPAEAIILVNFFKFREKAEYENSGESVSGSEAFSRYSSVSIPAMQKAGGSFLFVGPYNTSFVGEEEEWDLIAIGSYPNLQAFINLYSDKDYIAAFHHRTASCAAQKVLVCG